LARLTIASSASSSSTSACSPPPLSSEGGSGKGGAAAKRSEMDRFFFFGGFAFGDLRGDGAAAAATAEASSFSHHRNFGASIGGRALMPRGRRPSAACSPLLLAANPLRTDHRRRSGKKYFQKTEN
jgi:hypothetical protein